MQVITFDQTSLQELVSLAQTAGYRFRIGIDGETIKAKVDEYQWTPPLDGAELEPGTDYVSYKDIREALELILRANSTSKGDIASLGILTQLDDAVANNAW